MAIGGLIYFNVRKWHRFVPKDPPSSTCCIQFSQPMNGKSNAHDVTQSQSHHIQTVECESSAATDTGDERVSFASRQKRLSNSFKLLLE